MTRINLVPAPDRDATRSRVARSGRFASTTVLPLALATSVATPALTVVGSEYPNSADFIRAVTKVKSSHRAHGQHYALKRSEGGLCGCARGRHPEGARSPGEILAGAVAASSKCELQRLQPATHSLRTHRSHQVKRAARLVDPVPQLTGIDQNRGEHDGVQRSAAHVVIGAGIERTRHVSAGAARACSACPNVKYADADSPCSTAPDCGSA